MSGVIRASGGLCRTGPVESVSAWDVELLGAILAFLMFITSLGLRNATASGIVLPFAPTAIERHMRHRIATTLMQICYGLQFALRTTRILLSTRVDNGIQQMGGGQEAAFF